MNRYVKAAGLLMGAYALNEGIKHQEKERLDPYGTRIPVLFQMMNLLVTGKGDKTFVLLPDHITPSPILDYTALTDELSKQGRVVVIEPFGYGLSDSTDRPRTLQNISEEIHEALKSLDISRYILVSRGTSTIYLLDYVNRYGSEVEGFVGIDVSLPRELPLNYGPGNRGFDTLSHSIGLNRLALRFKPELVIPPPFDPRFTEEIRERIRILGVRQLGSASRIDEKMRMKENYENANKLSFPADLPVIFFVTGSQRDWQFVETSLLLGKREKGTIQLLKGRKPSHWYYSERIADHIRSFFS